MATIKAPERERYRGLLVHYLEGDKNKPIAVIAKGLGIPGKELGWMFLLNRLGFNVAYAPYRGTWLSEGRFLPDAEGELSVTEDISDLIGFSLGKFGSSSGQNIMHVIADCFGCSPSLVASTRYDEVAKIFIYGGMIYTDNEQLNHKYKTALNGEGFPRDKADKLGENLERSLVMGGRFFDGYIGFSLDAWYKMIEGKTGLNPHRHLPELARKQILAIHSESDDLVFYERVTDFVKALREYCLQSKLEPKAEAIVTSNGGGHKTGFGDNELLQAVQFLTEMDSITLQSSLAGVLEFMKEHHGQFQIPGGKPLIVPFHELVIAQIREFQRAGLLHDMPLEEILNQIF